MENRRPTLTFRRRPQRIVVTILLLLLLLMVLLPGVVRLATVFAMELATGGTATIENVDISLFQPSLRVEGLQLKLADARLLKFDHVDIELEGWPWRERHIAIRRIEAEGPSVTVEHSHHGNTRVAGFTLQRGGDEAESHVEEVEGKPWSIALGQLLIRNGELLLLAPGVRTEMALDVFSFGPIDTRRVDEPSRLTIAARVNGAPLALDGEAIPLSPNASATASLTIDSLALLPFANLAKPAVTKLDGELSINSRLHFQTDPQGAIAATQEGEIRFNGLTVAMTTPTLSVSSSQLSWLGRVESDLTDRFQQVDLLIDGALNEQGLQLALPDNQLTLTHQHLALEGESIVRWQQGIGVMVSDRGTMELADFKMELAGNRITNERLLWSGESRMALTDEAPQPELEASLNLRNEGLRLSLADQPVAIDKERLDWRGDIAMTRDGSLTTTSDIEIRNIAIRDSRDQFTVASIGQTQLKRLTLSRDATTERMDLAAIDIDTLRLHLERLESGAIRLPITRGDEKPVTTTEEVLARSEEASKPETPRKRLYRIGGLRVAGKSRLEYRDFATEPDFQQQIDIKHASVGAIDSRSPKQPVKLTLESRLNEFSRFDIAGNISPFADRPTLSIDGKLIAYEMPLVSPYASETIGYQVTRGHLNSDIRMAIDNGVMDGEVVLHINRLELHRPPDAGKGPLDDAVPIPLDTAISILQDKEDNITLSVPITGDINNPNFDIKDAINIAIAKGMKTAALGYLTVALQPFGAVLMAADQITGMPSGIRLDPVAFEPGTTTPTAISEGYPEQISNMLKERPKLHLKVCGIATESDRAMLLEQLLAKLKAEKKLPKKGEPAPTINDQQLLGLADERALFAKRALINRLEVDPNQLYSCPSLLDPSESAKPRIELLI